MSFRDSVKENLEKNLNQSLEEYFKGTEGFDDEQENKLVEFNDTLRRIIDKSIKLCGTREQLSKLIEAAVALEQRLEPLAQRRALPAYAKVFDFMDVGHTYAYSPITGRANPIAPPVHTVIENNRVICRVIFTDAYEGPPGCVHGGVVALTWDHVLAAATLIDDARGPTASLTINYRKPTPLKQELRFEAWIDRHEGKKVWIQGCCYARDGDGNEIIVTEATGLFINTLIREIYVTEEHLKQEIRR